MKTGHRHSAPAPSFQRPPFNSGAALRARQSGVNVGTVRNPERYVMRHRASANVEVVRELRRARIALYVSASLLVATALGSAWFLFGEVGSLRRSIEPLLVDQATRDDSFGERFEARNAPSMSVRAKDDAGITRRDFVRRDEVPQAVEAPKSIGETPADVIARGWSALERKSVQSNASDGRRESKGDRLASIAPIESAVPSARPQIEQILPRGAASREAKTALVEFETAPFPYSGNMPGSGKPFLDAGEAGKRGHTNFRGRVLREAEVFNDRRALLHIPPRFDPAKPGVIVVFFHGHGANLSDDVRDRQQVPAQITASGMNAVMVAPQFAVNAADSSAGKFWEQDGFRRFMDESAKQFAKLQGDPRSARAFQRMPIVIVAYSGGFGPTLSVIERGGVNSRIRGIVLLDALYTGTQKFANWIATNRSAFFVSAYTPHIQRHNTELKELLVEKSIPVSSELKPSRLPGSVAFLPAGDVSHRDFVTRAWTDNPITDILDRLDDAGAMSNAAREPNAGIFVARR